MYEEELIERAGLTKGEAKVYLALLELGNSTIGPIVENSSVARSFSYNLLDNLIEKGLVSFVTRDKTKYYQAAEPSRIMDYIEKKKQDLETDKEKIEALLPKLKLMQKAASRTEIAMYEGFKGIQENRFKRMIEHGALDINYGRKKQIGPDRHQQRAQEKLTRALEGAKAKVELKEDRVKRQQEKVAESTQKGHTTRLQQRQRTLGVEEEKLKTAQQKGYFLLSRLYHGIFMVSI